MVSCAGLLFSGVSQALSINVEYCGMRVLEGFARFSLPRRASMASRTPGETREDSGRLQALEHLASRRQALRELASATLQGAILTGSSAAPAEAVSSTLSGGGENVREWISGRGAQPKGSDDKTGTKKETRYLRCLSNCVAGCQKPTYGPERDREECLQLCQDECCTSYEQCTYPVVQNK